MRKEAKKVRGVFEKVPGSNIWWICYFDADGRKRREKDGQYANRTRHSIILPARRLPKAEGVQYLLQQAADDRLTCHHRPAVENGRETRSCWAISRTFRTKT